MINWLGERLLYTYTWASYASKELNTLLELLRNIDRNYRIVTVKDPPDGFDWCIAEGFRVFIARPVLFSPCLPATVAAILSTAASMRPRLRLIRGGGQDQAAEPLRASGCR